MSVYSDTPSVSKNDEDETVSSCDHDWVTTTEKMIGPTPWDDWCYSIVKCTKCGAEQSETYQYLGKC